MLLCAVMCAVLHIDIRKRIAIVRKDGLSVKIVSMELNHSRAKISAVLTTFGSKSPSFDPSSNRTINILTTFGSKSPSFGPSYRSRNILTTFVSKSPSFGPSYRSRNILTTFVSKRPSFGYSYRSRIF